MSLTPSRIALTCEFISFSPSASFDGDDRHAREPQPRRLLQNCSIASASPPRSHHSEVANQDDHLDMSIVVPPRGTRGSELPGFARALMRVMRGPFHMAFRRFG